MWMLSFFRKANGLLMLTLLVLVVVPWLENAMPNGRTSLTTVAAKEIESTEVWQLIGGNDANAIGDVYKKAKDTYKIFRDKVKTSIAGTASAIGDEYKKAKDTYNEKVPDNVKTAVAGTAAAVAGAATAGAATAAAGFSTVGPVAGSVAATWQASMGAVAAGSTFATIQSAAMTTVAGVAGAPILITGAVVGAGAYGAYEAYKYIQENDRKGGIPRYFEAVCLLILLVKFIQMIDGLCFLLFHSSFSLLIR